MTSEIVAFISSNAAETTIGARKSIANGFSRPPVR